MQVGCSTMGLFEPCLYDKHPQAIRGTQRQRLARKPAYGSIYYLMTALGRGGSQTDRVASQNMS